MYIIIKMSSKVETTTTTTEKKTKKVAPKATKPEEYVSTTAPVVSTTVAPTTPVVEVVVDGVPLRTFAEVTSADLALTMLGLICSPKSLATCAPTLTASFPCLVTAASTILQTELHWFN